VTAPNAVSLNFGFSKFHLPKGAKLSIQSADMSKFIRPFTSADNNAAQELWSPIIMSDDVIIELTVPANKLAQVRLELSHVGQGFRTFSQKTNKSGSCNIDVACSESEGWEKEVNAVAVISTGGSRFCTGFMVNNTSNDKTPYFMTAAHCRITASSAPSLVTYWNYQTSTCGGSPDGKLTDFQTGSTHLASYSASDMTIVKLNSAPNPEWNVHYAGWDRSGENATSAVAIHHPNVDEKSISFENEPTEITSYLGRAVPGNGTHVRVVDWDKGTTEPGSSGSPLFDQNHRVIGQLHGGGAACGNDESDWYGRIYTSWEGGGSETTSLKSHLDAANTGDLFVDTL
jgi:lysyl endopeptidase